MVIDLPANFIEQVKNIDWSAVREAVKDYRPALTVLRDTWDRETLAQISEGHLFVRDSILNEAIANNIGMQGTIRGVVLRSHANGRLDLVCTTAKKYKTIELSGTIEEFIHDGDKSYAVYRVREKNIPDHGFISWVFSRISLSMVERIMGHLDVSDRLPVDIRGNKIYVDFHEVLAASKLGQTEFQGHPLIDMIEIEGAVVQDGGIMFDTKLNVPDDVRASLRAVLRETGSPDAQANTGEGGEHWQEKNALMRMLCFVMAAIFFVPQFGEAAKKEPVTEKIVFVPHDGRPISSKQTADVVQRVGYDVVVPPPELLGSREDWGHPDELWTWLDENLAQPGVKAAVISSDAMIYGSLVGSRKHDYTRSQVLARAARFDELQRTHRKIPLYVFGSIMRTPRTGEASGHEEPEYYRRYGADIFRYTVLRDKEEVEGLTHRENRKEYDFLGRLIPQEALADWMGRRKNYAVNEYLIDLLRKRDTFRYLTLGRDDNAPFSQTHLESRHLTEAGADLGKTRFQTMAGIDEIALLMLTRAVNEQKHEVPFVFARYNWGRGADTVPAYSDEKIGTSVGDAVLAAGGMMVRAPEKADVVLMVNTNPDGRTYEANAVLNDGTPREGTTYFADIVADYVAKGYPVSVADIAFANGSDNALMAELQRRGLLYKIQAYAGWNTPTNSSGFALGEGMLVRHMDGDSIDHLLTTRYLDDWAYQANVRNVIARQLTWLRGDGFYGSLGTKIDAVSMRSSHMMNRFIEENLPPLAEVDSVVVTFPWNRMFESDILLEDPGFAQEYLAGRK